MPRINITEGLTAPLPIGIRRKLNENAMSKRFAFRWIDKENIYQALLLLAPKMCRNEELNDYTAVDAVHDTLIEICRIAERDGRHGVTDKRKRSGKRVKGDKAANDFKPSTKPVFTDWVQYVNWVIGRLRLTIKAAKRIECVDVRRTHPFDVSELSMTDTPIVQSTRVPLSD